MSKIKTTKKAIKNRYNAIIKINYCDLQYLLRHVEPFAYSTRIEGWACDYYNIDGVIISTGYAPIGNGVEYEIVERYNNQARIIWNNNEDYNIQVEKVNILLQEFINEITK